MAKKLYYKIGEACKILEIQPYVLRYWETEFPFLSPSKSKSGQRVYSDHELDVIRRIKELLYEEGYTIAGAKKKLESELAAGADGGGADTEKPVVAKKPTGKRGLDSGSGRDGGAGGDGGAKADSGAEKQIEQLRAGVEVGLRQAREILEVLRTDPSY